MTPSDEAWRGFTGTRWRDYIAREYALIVGLQTDAPLRRAIMPNGGLRMVQAGLSAYGYQLDPQVEKIWSTYRKSHNQGVFDAYPASVLAARRSHIIAGLPDAYGRGRIIGDYRLRYTWDTAVAHGQQTAPAMRSATLPASHPTDTSSSSRGRDVDDQRPTRDHSRRPRERRCPYMSAGSVVGRPA